MHTREEKIEAFGRLLDVLDELRVKCPWDRKQTNESLRPNTIVRRTFVRNWVMCCFTSYFMQK